MTNQTSSNTALEAPISEPQKEAESTEARQNNAPEKASGSTETTLITLADKESSSPRARDINFKIDQLETHIESLSKQYNTSEGKLRIAIGDVRSRTAIVTDEIAKVGELLKHSDTENKDWLNHLESRLKTAVDRLNEELGGIDEQVSSHQSSIQAIKQELNASYVKLDNRISAMQQDTQARFIEVITEQDKQHKTQQALAESLDVLEMKAGKTADELYGTQVEQAKIQRENKKKFIVSVSSLAAAIALTAGATSYLYWGAPITDAATPAELAALETNIADSYATKSEVSNSNDLVNSKLVILDQKLAQDSESLATSTAEAKASLEALSAEISALNLSVYGPEDGVVPAPKISIKESAWIAEQEASNYSIQLVGVYRERAMTNFINRNASSLDEHTVAYNISEYRGQDWYNVIYGSFPTFSEAQDALDKLPSSLQRNDPWIRQFDAIQKTGIN